MTPPSRPTVILVHGAFADASCFGGVIRELTCVGYDVLAPPTPLRGVSTDAATVHAVAASIQGPVVLVGHSYGGAVITQASADLPNAAGLVYLAAFAPAVGESCASVQQPFAAPLLASTIRPTAYDAVGAVGGPELVIETDRFRETFCADVGVDLAQVMALSQRPLAAAAIGGPLSAEGWSSHPTWYQVAARDHAISPDAQRFMAKRMNANIDEVDGCHAAFIPQPVAAASFIARALESVR